MTVTYEWVLEDLVTEDTNGRTDVVTVVNWRLYAIEGGVRGVTFGQEILDAPGEDFIPFANITESDLKSWVLGKREQTEAEMKSGAAAKLSEVQSPSGSPRKAPSR